MNWWQIFLLVCGGGALATVIIYKLKKIYYERKLLNRCKTAIKQIMREEYFKDINKILNEED